MASKAHCASPHGAGYQDVKTIIVLGNETAVIKSSLNLALWCRLSGCGDDHRAWR